MSLFNKASWMDMFVYVMGNTVVCSISGLIYAVTMESSILHP